MLSVFFLLSSTVVTVLMLNLLIGILSKNYETNCAYAQEDLLHVRAHLMATLHYRPWISWIMYTSMSRWENEYLWFAIKDYTAGAGEARPELESVTERPRATSGVSDDRDAIRQEVRAWMRWGSRLHIEVADHF